MEKRKYDMSKYADMHEETEIVGKDGTNVIVRDHIPYAEKEEMARDMVVRLVAIHDDSCIYDSPDYGKVSKYEIAKHYTDIDVEGMSEEDVADFLINNKLIWQIESYIHRDYEEVSNIFDDIIVAVKKTYEDDKSLTKAIRTSFGFLFTGEDITESLAHAEATKSVLFDAIGALRKAEKEKEETIDNGKVIVGGNVISFAKRE